MTEAEAYERFIVRFRPSEADPTLGHRIDGSKQSECPHCKASALLAFPVLPASWVWCSHCGAVVNQVHGAFLAPDMAESPGN
jgi:hypothetical protein